MKTAALVRYIKPMLEPMIRAQAEKLRTAALELPEPAGERNGVVAVRQASLKPFSILVTGDSSAAGVGAPTQELALAPRLAELLAERLQRPVAWHVLAKTGLTSSGVLDLLSKQELPETDLAFVVLGVNDISNDVPLKTALLQRNRIVRLLRERAGANWCLFPGLPEVERFPLLPQPLAWYGGAVARRNNFLQAKWASHPRRRGHVAHVPLDGVMHPSLMAADGFHPAPALYEKVARHLSDFAATRMLSHMSYPFAVG
jgi:lysophospholipase L1-like esterase